MPDYVPIDELVYQTGTMKLFAFTHGRGVWITDSPLPVELSSFIANYKNNNVQLDWITKTEVNNFGFNIERKIGTKQSSYGKWETIGFVNGNGNSNSTNSYSFKDDKLPYANFVNYRLKQIDNDGKFEYSDEIEISIAVNEFRLEQNYPNPFNPSTSISFSLLEKTDVTLSIYTLTGELVEVVVSSSLESGRHTYKWNSEKYSSGIYIYNLKTNDKSLSKKMLLLK
jgi:hypothetical protein